MFLKNIFAISENDNSLGSQFRKRRFSHFSELFTTYKSGSVKILDVGGKESFWVLNGFHNRDDIEITLLNLDAPKTVHSNLRSVKGDATNMKEFEDKSFDIVFSNSVIEHLHTYENQEKMAKECQRVGKRYYIQTPNKNFFLEPHYLLPFFQYLPAKVKFFILTKTKLSRLKKWDTRFAKQYIEEIRLIDRIEMKRLFPGGNLFKEKFLGLTKSYTSHNFEKTE